METITEPKTETAIASFGGEADELGSLARFFEEMPAGAFITIAKRVQGARTFVVASRQIPGRGTVTAPLFEVTTVDGERVDTRDALVLAALGLEQAEDRERRG
jgi:hypothetical protein